MIYGYTITKIESKINIIKNIKYLLFNYLSLIIFILTSIYLKYYLFNIHFFDIYFISILLIFLILPVIQYKGFPKFQNGNKEGKKGTSTIKYI